ncbi:MAG TPA: tRNA pseudouridine(13) synthase TruD [Steroidobacteraceae bacterium]|nr:tRNA pseudouridine(13) synthase TruD [Steroidobacteraceae bacterium]HNS28683.1 tRNA pseudouridine(13) synthase TruD [Steroidobacteraceae bacterium]
MAPVVPDVWRTLALDPPRAFGMPPVRGRVRVEPEDFRVDELLGFAPAGDGPHLLLHVRKRGANTEWVARELARRAACRPFDVGYAGLKDRHAVTTQWFTVPRGKCSPGEWLGHEGEGYVVLEAHAHTRKLPRGALAGNRFELRIRDIDGDRGALATRLDALAARGVPDYFGPQRFGRALSNLARVQAGDFRSERAFTLSAARSLVFNAVLARRVAEGSWARIEAGDVANLDGKGSVFAVEAPDEALDARVAALDLHPTGPLWGVGDPRVTGRIAALEAAVREQFAPVCQALEEEGVAMARRPLRAAVRDVTHVFEGDTLVLQFRLAAGSFATTVLREVLDA